MVIISFIWLVLNLSVHVLRPCLYMLGSPSRTVVFVCVSRPCLYMLGSWTPVVCERWVYHTRSSRGVSKWRTLLTVHTKEEHIITLILSERDHLIMLPSRSKQNKMHKRINITCMKNVIWYGPLLHLISILCVMAWSPSFHRRGTKVHSASILDCPSKLQHITWIWYTARRP